MQGEWKTFVDIDHVQIRVYRWYIMTKAELIGHSPKVIMVYFSILKIKIQLTYF